MRSHGILYQVAGVMHLCYNLIQLQKSCRAIARKSVEICYVIRMT